MLNGGARALRWNLVTCGAVVRLQCLILIAERQRGLGRRELPAKQHNNPQCRKTAFISRCSPRNIHTSEPLQLVPSFPRRHQANGQADGGHEGLPACSASAAPSAVVGLYSLRILGDILHRRMQTTWKSRRLPAGTCCVAHVREEQCFGFADATGLVADQIQGAAQWW